MAGTEKFVQQCEGCWPADQPRPRVLTRAPGRLDCMGGMADFSGGLALQMSIERAAYVAAGPRTDQRVHVQSVGWQGAMACGEWPISAFYRSDGQLVTGAVLAKAFTEENAWARHVAGVCLALLESGELPHLAGGANIVLQSDIPAGCGLASSAAIQVAVGQALAGLFEIELDPLRLARLCRAADVEVAGSEAGLVDHLPCLLGDAGALLQIRCQPDEVLGELPMPREVAFAAVPSGVSLPLCRQRYADNRVASLMGRRVIERLLRTSSGVGDPTGGYLANISPSEYVSRFRDELPVKIRGRDFLDRFGADEELESQVDSSNIYKVRSRTEHHIYENDRTHRLMERLARARRTGERDALVEAGELMYASHWSYSQRCGMGSLETDVLVNAIRERGPARGLYGAKVTGMGCGGTVAVLMAAAPGAQIALQEACAEYASRVGHSAAPLLGSSPGAFRFGRRPFRAE